MLTLGLGMAMTRAALEWGKAAMEQLAAMQTGNHEMKPK